LRGTVEAMHTAVAVQPGYRPGDPGYRRLSVALFAAGLATFALLYST
jgi:MFS transporter, YNFM family, putative membrane transport protein